MNTPSFPLRNMLSKALVVFSIALAIVAGAQAQVTWNATTTNTTWTVGSNWIGGSAPTSVQTAVFNSGNFVQQINGSGASVGGIIVGDGNTTTGVLTLSSTGAITIGSQGVTVTGNGSSTANPVGQVLISSSTTTLNGTQSWSNNGYNSTNGTAGLKVQAVAAAASLGAITWTLGGNGTSGSNPSASGLNNFNIDIAGAISQGAGTTLSLVYNSSGQGLLSLNGANSFSGNLTIQSGVVKLAAATSAGTGTINLGAGTAADVTLLRDNFIGTNAINVASGSTGNITIGNSGSGGIATFSGAVTMGSSLKLLAGSGGGGNLTMTGGFTGTGNLTLNTVGASGSIPPGITISSGSINMVGNLINTGNVTATNTISSVIGTNVQSLTQNSTTTTLVLAGNNTYTGPTTITAGTLQIGNGTSGSLSSSSAISNNGTLAFNRSDTITQGTDFNSVISGTGALTKNGTGTLILNGSNTYTGNTTINQGTLQFNRETGSLATGNLTLGGPGGTFNMDNTGASGNLTQTFNKVTFSSGDNQVRTTDTAGFAQSVTFTSSYALSTGATGAFYTAGTPSATNGFVLTGQTLNATIFKGIFYGLNNSLNIAYAYYDAGGFVRAINYNGTEGKTSGANATLSNTNDQQITGSISAQGNATFARLNIYGNNDFTLAPGATVNLDGILKNGGNGTSTISGGTGIKVNSANGTLVVYTSEAGDNLVFNTPILANGNNAFTKAGAGTLTLSGNNTFTGGQLTINGGTLLVNGTGVLNAGSFASNVLINAGTLNYASSTNQTLGGVISGAGSLAKTGTGALTLSGNNTFSGGMQITSGTLFTTGSTGTTKLGSGAITLGSATGGDVLLSYGAQFASPSNDFIVASGTGNRTLRLTQAGTITLSGNITLNNDLIVDTAAAGASNGFTLGGAITGTSRKITFTNTAGNANATTTISGVMTGFTGLLEVAGGAILATGTNGMNMANATVNVLDNGKFSFNQGGVIAGLNGNSTATAFGGVAKSLTIAGSGNYNFAGSIQNGSGNTNGLTKNGTGTQILSGANTYNGTTTINAGTLQIGNGTTTGSLSASSTIVNNGVLAFNRSDTLTQGTGFSNLISGTGGLTMNGAGVLSLALGNNTFTGGVTINAGTVSITQGSGLSGNASVGVTFGGNGTLQFRSGGTGQFFATRAITIGSGATGTIENLADAQVDTAIGGAGSLVKSGTANLTLTGNSTYSGTTTVTAGKLVLSGTGALPVGTAVSNSATFDISAITASSATVGSIAGNGTFNLGAKGLTAGGDNSSTIVSGTIAGVGGSLAKTGSGNLTLSGTNTYTGATTVTSGTLLINGSTSSSSAVAVNGGTLGGNGTIGGAVTVNSGGFLSPGNSPGLLTMGSLVLNSGSTTTFEINGIAVRGTNYDAIDITAGSGLTLNGTFTINFTNGTALDNTTNINLFGYTGTHTGDFASMTSTGFYTSGVGGWTHGVGDVWTLSSGAQTLTFSEVTGYLNVVPEPSTWALLAFSLTTVMVLRRRRQS